MVVVDIQIEVEAEDVDADADGKHLSQYTTLAGHQGAGAVVVVGHGKSKSTGSVFSSLLGTLNSLTSISDYIRLPAKVTRRPRLIPTWRRMKPTTRPLPNLRTRKN